MTIANTSATEDTLGVSGTDRQQGLCRIIMDAVEKLPDTFDVDLRSIQSHGSITDPDTPQADFVVILRLSKLIGEHVHVLASVVIQPKQLSVETTDIPLAHVIRDAVIQYGKDTGDAGEVRYDSTEEDES